MANTCSGRDEAQAIINAEDRDEQDPKLTEPTTTMTTMTWSILLPDYFPPSPNRYRMKHWSKVRQLAINAREHLHLYVLQAGGAPVFKGRVRVEIVRLWGKRQRALDVDNLYGSVKPLVDALRPEAAAGKGRQGGLGIIEDDRPGMIELDVDQRRNPHGDTCDTLITITGQARP